jgi:hypothetical protein
VQAYFRDYNRFQTVLLAYIHFTGGMPSRGTEIASVLMSNTRQVGQPLLI